MQRMLKPYITESYNFKYISENPYTMITKIQRISSSNNLKDREK